MNFYIAKMKKETDPKSILEIRRTKTKQMPVLLEIVRIIDENFKQCFPQIEREQFLQDFEEILVRKDR